MTDIDNNRCREACVNFVFCIDATDSMYQFLENFKTFHTYFLKAVSEKEIKRRRGLGDVKVKQIGIKIIVFRDFSWDYYYAIKQSKFFNLLDETAEYEAFINDIQTFGGRRRNPKSSLESLHLAIHSDWLSNPNGGYTRDVIVLFTDAPPYMLDDPVYRKEASHNPLYPHDTPGNLNGILDEWHGILRKRAIYLRIFAPNDERWHKVSDMFKHSEIRYTENGDGLYDISNYDILNTLVRFVDSY